MTGTLSPGAARPFPSEAPASISARAGWVPAACVCSLELASSRDPPGEKTGGLFAGWEGVASLGLSLPLSLPLASYLQRDGTALLWSFSFPLFCEPPAVCSGWSIFLSLSHSLKKSPTGCSQGLLAGPHPKQCRRLLSAPPPPLRSAPSCWWRVRASGGTFLLGVAFRHVICGPSLIFPPS